jgi:uncharacterized protein
MKMITKAAGAMLLGIWLAGAALADENSVSVVGKGEVKVKPDAAFVTMYVKADALTMVDAAKQAGEKVDEVKKALKIYKEIKGIAVTDASMGELERQSVSPDDKEESQHPEVVRQLRITMRPDPVKVCQVIDTAISAGALMQSSSHISYGGDGETIVMYGVLKPADAEAQANQAALADARKRAESLAALVGKKVGGVMRIAGDASAAASPMTVLIDERESNAPAIYIGRSSEEIVVPGSLTVVFELKAK